MIGVTRDVVVVSRSTTISSSISVVNKFLVSFDISTITIQKEVTAKI